MSQFIKSSGAKQSVTPLLFQDAVPRTGTDLLPGCYSPGLRVWTVDGTPLVTSAQDLAEMRAKTEAQIERDDDVSPRFLLEMQTKTKADIERDDQVSPLALLELQTKTSTVPERDD